MNVLGFTSKRIEEYEAEAKAYSQSCPHQPDGEVMKGRNHFFFVVTKTLESLGYIYSFQY